jgi:hypothetical protein
MGRNAHIFLVFIIKFTLKIRLYDIIVKKQKNHKAGGIKMKKNIKFYKEININGNTFFADGHVNNSHKSEDQKYRNHIFLDFDLSDKEKPLNKNELVNIVKKMEPTLIKTNAYGVLFTGNGIHIEYLFDINVPLKYGHSYKELYRYLISKFNTIISHFRLKVDYSCETISKLDRVPESINAKNGKVVEWLWKNEYARLDHRLLTNIKIITKDNIKLDDVNVDKIQYLKTELNTKRKSKEELIGESFMSDLVKVMYKYVYDCDVDTNKSFKCVIHKENKPSVFIANNRYFDLHNEKGKSKSIVDLFYSFILNEDVIVHEDAYAKYFHSMIDILNITFEDTASQYNRIKSYMNDVQTVLKTQLNRSQINRAMQIIKELALYNVVHNKNSEFLLSERFLSEYAMMDNATANKITQLLVSSNLIKRKYVLVKNKRIELKDFVNDGSTYFTYVYDINLNNDPIKWVAIVKNVLSKISIKQICKRVLNAFFNTDMILGRSDSFSQGELQFERKQTSSDDINKKFSMNLKLFKLKMINIFLLDNKAIYNIS